MNNMNTKRQKCSEVVYSEKVHRISDMKWAGQKHRAEVGICQFCGHDLPAAYRVHKDGKCYEFAADTPGGEKAARLIDENAIPMDVQIYGLSSCEVMCDEQLYYDGMAHYSKRAKAWRDTVQENARKRTDEAEAAVITTSKSW